METTTRAPLREFFPVNQVATLKEKFTAKRISPAEYFSQTMSAVVPPAKVRLSIRYVCPQCRATRMREKAGVMFCQTPDCHTVMQRAG